MEESITSDKALKIAYWRAIVIGPFAVLPASIILMLISSAITSEPDTFKEVVGMSLFVSIWGISIAYIAIFTYGSVIWYSLLWFNRLTLLYLLFASIIPAFIVSIISGDIELSLSVGFYSLSVGWLSWFVGLRHVQKL